MSEDSAAKIVRLVELLHSDLAIEWEEVQRYVAGYPAWWFLVKRWEIESRGRKRGLFGRRPEPEESLIVVPPAFRQRLLESFAPYGLLLDQRYTLIERACLLEEAGYDAVAFCIVSCERGWQISEASKILEAIAEQQNLLRGAPKPEIEPQELLRSAPTGANADDSLLQSANLPDQIAEQKPGWLRRIFQWRGK